MIWLTWRQFRGQALTALAALAVLAIYLVLLGLAIRNSYDVNVIDCEIINSCSVSDAKDELERQYGTLLQLSGALLIVVPAIIGTFWGAPLITRELETGTHRLVWNQSVTRTRWLAVKLAFVALASVALTGALSLLLTWAASPYDKLLDDRFAALTFPARNIAPLGYAVFAFVLGTTIGLIARRTLPAMAITLAIFTAVQILTPAVIRPHLQPPITETMPFTPAAVTEHDGRINLRDSVHIEGYTIPGAWVLSSSTQVLDATGDPITGEQLEGCVTGNEAKDMACIAERNLHFTVSYQPANRYWTFQWLELAAFLALAALLAGFGFWRIPRGLS